MTQEQSSTELSEDSRTCDQHLNGVHCQDEFLKYRHTNLHVLNNMATKKMSKLEKNFDSVG